DTLDLAVPAASVRWTAVAGRGCLTLGQMAGERLVILDPSGRAARELCEAADRAGITPVVVRDPDDADLSNTGAYLLPVTAAELAHDLPSATPRWLVGDGASSGKLAGAAIGAAAAGVLLAPVQPATLA